MDAIGFTHALVKGDLKIVPALTARGWTEIHRDEHYVLLARP